MKHQRHQKPSVQHTLEPCPFSVFTNKKPWAELQAGYVKDASSVDVRYLQTITQTPSSKLLCFLAWQKHIEAVSACFAKRLTGFCASMDAVFAAAGSRMNNIKFC